MHPVKTRVSLCTRLVRSRGHKTDLSMKLIMLINVKMPTIVGILTFINMINTTSVRLKAKTSLFVDILVFISS